MDLTHFVVSAEDLLTCFEIVDSERRPLEFSWRAWGGEVAEWANQRWIRRLTGFGRTARTRADRPWHYLDFYMGSYIDYLWPGYDEWARQLGKIVELKDRRFGNHL